MTRVRTVVVLVLAVLAVASASAEAGDDRLEGVVEVFRDDDLVVFGTDGTDLHAAEVAGADGTPAGYTRLTSATLLSRYQVRLVDSPRISEVRGPLARALVDAQQYGPELTLAETVVATQDPGHGQIDVVVSRSSPCRGSWLACAGPTVDEGAIRSSRIWINPRLLDRPAAQIDNTLRHELGHAFGLGHYDATHEGNIQVMHSRSFVAGVYQSGDAAGLRAMTPAASRVVLDAPPSYAAGAIRVRGAISVAPGAEARVRNRYRSELLKVEGGRFDHRLPADAGDHLVCVEVLADAAVADRACADLVAPGDPVGVFEGLTAGPYSLRATGWAIDPQTGDAIDVAVSVNGVTLWNRANDSHEGAAAAHPEYGGNHGFAVTRPVPAATHEVCITALNVGGGTDTSLGCRRIKVSGFTALG